MYNFYYFEELFRFPRMQLLGIALKMNFRRLLSLFLLWTFVTNAYCRYCITSNDYSLCLLIEQDNTPKEINSIVIWTKGGKSLAILFEDLPKVSKTETNIVIISKQVEVKYPLTDYLKFTFEKFDDESKVESVYQDNRTYFQFSANQVDIYGLTPNEIVSIYAVNGMKELSSKVNSDGKVSISNLSAGIHILKTNNTNLKFIIK